jgi:crossover junction endodeoxyribonuclease RuvC
VILGIDPGLSCGWAILDSNGARVGSGTWDLSVRSRWEGAGIGWLRFRRSLEAILDNHPIEAIGYEEVRRHAGTDAAHVYGALVGVVQAVGEWRKIPYTSIPVGQVKKAATGKGNAGKDEMVAAVLARWNHRCESDDEADAHWIAAVAALEIGRKA